MQRNDHKIELVPQLLLSKRTFWGSWGLLFRYFPALAEYCLIVLRKRAIEGINVRFINMRVWPVGEIVANCPEIF